MLRSRVSAWSLAVMILPMLDCAGSYCAEPEHESDAMCQLSNDGTVAAFTVSPTRITLNKDSATQLTITAYQKLFNKLATLSQSGGAAKPISIGVVQNDGTLKVTIQASDLANQGFVPGPAEVEIGGQKRQLRIFVAPKFDGATFSAVRSVAGDHGAGNMAAPSWVGVQANGIKKILTLNEYAIATIAKQAIGEYSYDSASKTISKFSPLLFSAYSSTPYADTLARGIALSATDFVIPEFGNASTSLITQCSLDGACAGSVAAPYGSISSLSAALNSKLYVGIFNAKVLTFSDANLTTSISINGSSASVATPALVTVYDANADTHPDISIWHRDGNVSVALSDSTGKNLTFESKDGEALKKLGVLGNGPPDAVAAGDIDQDGLDDLVVVKGGSLYVLSNLGAGLYSASDPLPIPAQGPMGGALLTPVSAIAIGDLSADDVGLQDLVLVSKANRFIAVMENAATLR